MKAQVGGKAEASGLEQPGLHREIQCRKHITADLFKKAHLFFTQEPL